MTETETRVQCWCRGLRSRQIKHRRPHGRGGMSEKELASAQEHCPCCAGTGYCFNRGGINCGLDSIDYVRASGEAVCPRCKKLYREHDFAKGLDGYDGHPFLRELCDGALVKL